MPSLELDALDLETASSGGDDDGEYDAPSRARFERTRATFRRSAARKYSACQMCIAMSATACVAAFASAAVVTVGVGRALAESSAATQHHFATAAIPVAPTPAIQNVVAAPAVSVVRPTPTVATPAATTLAATPAGFAPRGVTLVPAAKAAIKWRQSGGGGTNTAGILFSTTRTANGGQKTWPGFPRRDVWPPLPAKLPMAAPRPAWVASQTTCTAMPMKGHLRCGAAPLATACLCPVAGTLDGEQVQTTQINVKLNNGETVTLPIEKLYPNMRSKRFERLHKLPQYYHNFDGAGNADTPFYLAPMPSVINVFQYYKRRIFLEAGSGTWGGQGEITGYRYQAPVNGKYPAGKAYDWSWTHLGLWDEYHEFDFIPTMDAATAKRKMVRPTFLSKGTKYEYHNGLVAARPYAELAPLEFGLNHFIKANFDVEDFIHLKIDIENCEWDVLMGMAQDGSLDYIDEMTIEAHFFTDAPAWKHFMKAAGLERLLTTGGCPGMRTIEQAHDFLQMLRDRGIFTHTYP